MSLWIFRNNLEKLKMYMVKKVVKIKKKAGKIKRFTFPLMFKKYNF